MSNLYIAYCKDSSHVDPVVLAAGDTACSVASHGVHTDTGALTKMGVDFKTLRDSKGSSLHSYLETTYKDDMV